MGRRQNPTCPLYRRPRWPEEEDGRALPHGDLGLDVIALVGKLCFAAHRSPPEIHRALARRGPAVVTRSVTNFLPRYEELVALRLANRARVAKRLRDPGAGHPSPRRLADGCGARGLVGAARLPYPRGLPCHSGTRRSRAGPPRVPRTPPNWSPARQRRERHGCCADRGRSFIPRPVIAGRAEAKRRRAERVGRVPRPHTAPSTSGVPTWLRPSGITG